MTIKRMAEEEEYLRVNLSRDWILEGKDEGAIG